MNLNELKTAFRATTITKAQFIESALAECHAQLHAYAQALGDCAIDQIRIDASGVSFVMRDGAVRLFAPPNEARVAPLEVLNFDAYEPAETRVIDELTENAQCILDVGANIGWVGLRLAQRLPQAQVYAFEPMPTSFAYLCRNIATNQLGGRVTPFNYALSDHPGTVTLFVAPTHGTNASLVNVAARDDAQPISILTTTLDLWADGFKALSPDFIKCDVEGAELLVFRGAEKTLRQARPAILTELLRKWTRPFGYHPNDLIRYMQQLDYTCWAIGEGQPRPCAEVTEETVETSYVFLHNVRHAATLQRWGQK